MSQSELPDLGHSVWRSTTCPRCGKRITWSLVTDSQKKVTCTNEVGERSKKVPCGFTLRRAEWDYIREKGPDAAKRLMNMVDAASDAKAAKRKGTT